MRKWSVTSLLILLLALVISTSAFAENYFESLKPDQNVNGFKVANVYENASGNGMGARFVSAKNGFILDLLQIQSVPQGFFWVNSPIYDDMGEPHACEHLLLGKGNRGRYVATLEDMSLGSSSAYTAQFYTCYHFNTTAGEDTFYKLFEAKLNALVNPDFTDEEIRREVCNIGVTEDPESHELVLEEKGTVYTEMVSSFEKFWYHLYHPMDVLTYGADHPAARITGGDPAAMRKMVPKDLWDFHKATYHLGNMGVIVSIPDNIDVDAFLAKANAILDRVQSRPEPDAVPSMRPLDLPQPNISQPYGQIRLASYPSDNPEDPAYMLFGYPPYLKLNNRDYFMFDLFLTAFASGQTSNLYDLFINSQTRKIDLGGNAAWGSVSDDQGNPVYFGLNGIKGNFVSEKMLDSARTLIMGEIQRIHDLPDGSEELAKFNDNVKARLMQSAKQFDQFMNSPPMFGFRSGPGGRWYSNLRFIENDTGFHKSLVQKPYFDYAEELLNSSQNVWRDYIDQWKLLAVKPYAVGCAPNADLMAQLAKDKKERLASYAVEFEKKYGVDDPQQAIAKYKEEFDANTAELEAIASSETIPGFIDNPPMTLDDQLKYEVMTLPGNVPMVASTFDNMTSSRVGIAMRLDVLPESLLVYVPYLPDVLTDIGVVDNDKIIPYDDMQNRLRREVLGLDASFSSNGMTGRVELVLRGSGSNLDELHNAIGWMNKALYSPYLSEDNLPRMKDVIDQKLVSLRNRMKGSEENWVGDPAGAYRYQTNPLYLSAQSFLTQIHHAQRLKWLLTDPGTNEDQQALSEFLDDLKAFGKDRPREKFTELFEVADNPEATPSEEIKPVLTIFTSEYVSDDAKGTARQILSTLKSTLPDIPDANLTGDWTYLCDEIKADLMVKPDQTIAGLKQTLDLIRHADNARMFMISSSADRDATLGEIKQLAGKLGTTSSKHVEYADTYRIVKRAHSRNSEEDKPVYAGLMNEGTRNGVLIFSAVHAGRYDTSRTAVLDALAGKLYGGSGAHGLFMKTWGAGLAYSNGFGYSDATGRVSYYAERCPDVAQTMGFVVGVLKNAEDDPYLKEYAIAQAFLASRAASKYESRGEAMAADLADGITPEVVRRYRQAILDVRDMDNLYETIKQRMPGVYGEVLIGYGPSLADSKDATLFMIGPESQFESLQRYIETTEGKEDIWRLYPRDFWLTRANGKS